MLCFGLLAVALMAVLVLNISVSTAQYQLVQLRSEQSTLTKQNQDLTQQVQNFDAPQNLAAKATELGMVASTGKGQIDLSTLTVTGKAKPAVKGDAPGAVIAAPAVAGQLSVVPPATVNEPLANRKPAAAAPTAGCCSATQPPPQPRCRTGRRAVPARRPPPRPHRPSNSTAAPFPPPRRRSRDSNAGRTTSQASSKETSWRRTPARHARRKRRARPGGCALGLGVMLTLLLVVGGKLFLVQGLDVGGMAEAALQNRLTPIELPAERGSILDANGTVLASSVIRYNVVVDQTVNTKTETFRRLETVDGKEELVKVSRDQGISELAAVLGMDQDTLKDALTGDQRYYIVAKDLKPDVEDRISKLQIPGIVTEGTSKRVYPNGSVAGGIVGFLKDGTTGQAGLEQTQDEILKGTPGKRLFEIGADGLRIPVGVDQLTPAVNGKDIKLTLNSDLQYFAQQAIQSQRDKLSAEWGVVIVQDIKTGDIIAMADTNSPDPNDPGKVDAQDRGVRAVTAAYEPGSVEKMITAAALIEEGKSSPAGQVHHPAVVHRGRADVQRLLRPRHRGTDPGRHPWLVDEHRHGHGRPAAQQGAALRLAEEVRHRRGARHRTARRGQGHPDPARAMGRPPGVHRAVRPGRLAVHAPDRPGLPKHRQQRRDAPAAADRQLHQPGRHRGKSAGAGRRGRSSPRTPPGRCGTSSRAPSRRARSRKPAWTATGSGRRPAPRSRRATTAPPGSAASRRRWWGWRRWTIRGLLLKWSCNGPRAISTASRTDRFSGP